MASSSPDKKDLDVEGKDDVKTTTTVVKTEDTKPTVTDDKPIIKTEADDVKPIIKAASFTLKHEPSASDDQKAA